MEKDKILEMFFDTDRWIYAIDKGVGKDIDRSKLYQLCKPETRVRMCKAIQEGLYEIAPPHTAAIPKDDGTDRIVYVNEPIDRVFLSIANDLLFDLMPDMVHKQCKSYQRGIGCGKVVQEISAEICRQNGPIIGWKSDLSKYFDSVPVQYIDEAFDNVEERHGKSMIITVLRKYYHSDFYFDTDGVLKQKYQSLKQGCSVASWLADVVLKHLDERISQMNVKYVRYSDDCLCIGEEYEKAMNVMNEELAKMQMKLNPKKVEYLSNDKWFKFLGYSIKGADISLSSSRIKTFQHEIEHRTIKTKTTLRKAINAVNRYLYKGNGEFSWATQVLPVCNVKRDIDELNNFVMDALRAVKTGKTKIGGLGFVRTQEVGCINRGIGRNVRANRTKTDGKIPGYLSIGCAQRALRTSRPVYNTLISQL